MIESKVVLIFIDVVASVGILADASAAIDRIGGVKLVVVIVDVVVIDRGSGGDSDIFEIISIWILQITKEKSLFFSTEKKKVNRPMIRVINEKKVFAIELFFSRLLTWWRKEKATKRICRTKTRRRRVKKVSYTGWRSK